MRPPGLLALLGALFGPLVTIGSAAAPLSHFAAPAFLRLTPRLQALPVHGREVLLTVRCEIEHADSLQVSLQISAPPGLILTALAREATRRVQRGKPVEWRTRIRVMESAGGAAISIAARAPYPRHALRRYYLARFPLFGPRAQQQYESLATHPPACTEARATVWLPVSREEPAAPGEPR